MRVAPLIPFLLLAACGGGGATGDEGEKAAPEPVAEVGLAPAQLGTAGSAVLAYGTTEAGPGAQAALTAPAEAIVSAVPAPTGTAVVVGQAVVALRPSRATRTEAAKAASDLQAATAAYARALRLRRDGLVSDADVETARAALATARATSANLGLGAGGLTLRAPVAGTVQGLTVKPGDQIAAGANLATIAGRGDVRARFGVDPALASRLRPGQVVQVQSLAGGAGYPAPVVGVDPAVDPATRLANVYVRVPGAARLAPGEPLRAMLPLGAAASGVAIPYAALLDDGGRSYVFVVRGGAAHRVDVSPGNSSGDTVQILKGVQPGDRVVVEGGTALEDGMKVRVAGAGSAR